MKKIEKLYAIIDTEWNILKSRWGSSSKSHIMVYASESSAKKALSSPWTSQVIKKDAKIILIYENKKWN